MAIHIPPTMLSQVRPIDRLVALGSGAAAIGSSTLVITTTTGINPGDFAVIGVQYIKDSAITISSVTDTAGNTWTQSKTHAWDTSTWAAGDIWHCVNAKYLPSGSSITVTFSGITSNGESSAGGMVVREGIIPSSPVDKTASTSTGGTSTTTPSSGSTGTLSQANEFSFALFSGYGGLSTSPTFTEASGFTQLYNLIGGARYVGHTAYQIVSSTAALNYNPTASSNVNGCTLCVTYKGIF